MDLLDSVLRTAKAEKFTEKFKASGIDTATLSLLTNEDLQLLNVEGADTRQNILNCINNLQVPKEKKKDLLVTEDYVLSVLHHISQQLLLHAASLSYALTVEDIVLCDLRLSSATRCLVSCVEGLEKGINDLEQKIFPRPKKTSKKYFVLGAITVIPFGVYFAYNFVKARL